MIEKNFQAGDYKFSLKTADGGHWRHLDVTPDSDSPHIVLDIFKF